MHSSLKRIIAKHPRSQHPNSLGHEQLIFQAPGWERAKSKAEASFTQEGSSYCFSEGGWNEDDDSVQKGQSKTAKAEASRGRGGVGQALSRSLQEEEGSSRWQLLLGNKPTEQSRFLQPTSDEKPLFQLLGEENKGTAVEHPPNGLLKQMVSLQSHDSGPQMHVPFNATTVTRSHISCNKMKKPKTNSGCDSDVHVLLSLLPGPERKR